MLLAGIKIISILIASAGRLVPIKRLMFPFRLVRTSVIIVLRASVRNHRVGDLIRHNDRVASDRLLQKESVRTVLLTLAEIADTRGYNRTRCTSRSFVVFHYVSNVCTPSLHL